MLDDGSGEEIVVKGEDYPIGLIKLATLVHRSVHEVDVIDADALDKSQKAKLMGKIADPTVTSDPSWAALGAKPEWKKWNKDGKDDAAHARQMHQEQIQGLPLQVMAFAKGADAKAQVNDKSRTGFRTMIQSPKYMRQLGAAHAADLFTGNADRMGTQIVNLGNWMTDTNERIQLIDNMDNNARQSFENKKSGDNIFGPDMQEWGKNPGAYYAAVCDRLLQEAAGKGDADIEKWAKADGGFIRKFMIDDFEWGFKETVANIVKRYATDKKSKAGRATKREIKSLENEDYLDYWEVLKARARYLQNPKKAASLAKTVKKRQTGIDKKRAKKG
jgi:hypothetical protein